MGNNENQTNNSSSNEIDLLEFCAILWKSFKSLLNRLKDLFVAIIVFFIRKSLWLIAFALLGGILGFVFHSNTKPTYSSYLEANTGAVNSEIVIAHINKLKELTSRPKKLATFLGLTEDEAKNINRINAYFGIDANRDYMVDYVDFKNAYNPKDTTVRRINSYLYLKVSVFDEEVFPALRRGLLDYIRNNEYILNLHSIDTIQKKAMIMELKREMQKIDTLHRYQMRHESVSVKDIILSNKPDIKLYYTDLLDLYQRKASIEKELLLFKEPIVIIHNFTPLALEEASLIFHIMAIGVAGAILGLICALLWQYRKPIWRLITEDSGKA
jgi:hypothetical protein